MQASWGLLETYFIKFSKPSVIDNVTFRLHYKLTCYFLLMCSALSTCYQHFGKPIVCLKSEVPHAGKQKVFLQTFINHEYPRYGASKSLSLSISPPPSNIVFYLGSRGHFEFRIKYWIYRLFERLVLDFGNLFTQRKGLSNATWHWTFYKRRS